MEANTIGRSYAEGLYAVAEKHKLHNEFLAGFATLDVMRSDRLVEIFLESPKIDRTLKKKVLQAALNERVHPLFLNFVLLVIDKRRQKLYGMIAHEYRALVDEAAGRLHVRITLAREPSAELLEDIRGRLSEIFGNTVVPHVTVDERILGGIVVRQGDQVIDGSLRRRLLALRRRLVNTTT
ncbi:MAG TPA: ATP synthase F1 subunit delta [Longimicrobiales bacterium]